MDEEPPKEDHGIQSIDLLNMQEPEEKKEDMLGDAESKSSHSSGQAVRPPSVRSQNASNNGNESDGDKKADIKEE